MWKVAVMCAWSVVSLQAWAGGVELQTEKENVVSGRLLGQWSVSETLTSRLRKGADSQRFSLTFTEDRQVAAKIPDADAERFRQNKWQVYLAGQMTFLAGERVTKGPFVLSQVYGNPHVIFWLEKDGNEFGNGESFNLMLVPAEERAKDLLFVGGDHASEPFMALERVPDSPEGK
jgi:hypothetical protein